MATRDGSAVRRSAQIKLPHTLRAPSLARRWLAERLAAWGRAQEDIATAMLIAGELVTNAVRYAESEPRLTVLECAPGVLRCSVQDDNATRPVLARPDCDADSGRGMWLIAALSSAWGVEEDGGHPGGKTVWAELRA